MTRRRGPRGSRGGGAPQPRRPPGGHERVEEWPDGDWVVRQVTGSSSTKSYRCPGCDQLIPPATPHVVAWPVDPRAFSGPGVDERRHWHTACWRARYRRGRR